MRARILEKELDKKVLISRLSSEKRPLMIFYEDPPGPDLTFERVSESITLIRPPYDYGTLEKWLYLGNWQAIFPPNRQSVRVGRCRKRTSLPVAALCKRERTTASALLCRFSNRTDSKDTR